MTEQSVPPEPAIHHAFNESATEPDLTDPRKANPHERSRPEGRRPGH
jgi:hypothetical protein